MFHFLGVLVVHEVRVLFNIRALRISNPHHTRAAACVRIYEFEKIYSAFCLFGTPVLNVSFGKKFQNI